MLIKFFYEFEAWVASFSPQAFQVSSERASVKPSSCGRWEVPQGHIWISSSQKKLPDVVCSSLTGSSIQTGLTLPSGHQITPSLLLPSSPVLWTSPPVMSSRLLLAALPRVVANGIKM